MVPTHFKADAGDIRLVLRVYFMVFMAAIAWVADKCLYSRAKLRLVRTKILPVNQAVGWVQGFGLVEAIWSLQRPPGGRLGCLIMVVVFLLSSLTDLIPAKLVVPSPHKTRCNFDSGLIFNKTGSSWKYPPSSGASFVIAQNSQYYSTNHSCQMGIYSKANQETNFCAQDNDILGTWLCTTGPNVSYTAGKSSTAIKTDLQKRALLPFNTSSIGIFRSEIDTDFSHLVLWGSDATSDLGDEIWGIQAAVQTKSTYEDPLEMLTMNCSMHAPAAEAVLREMYSWSALAEWVETFQGVMYYGSDSTVYSDFGGCMATLLNTMIMIQGSDDNLFSEPGPDDEQTQGCIVTRTYVPVTVEVLVLVVAGLLICLLVAWVFYVYQLRWYKAQNTHDQGMKDAAEHLPDNLMAWVALAAREHMKANNLSLKGDHKMGLKDCVVGLEFAGGRPEMTVKYKDANTEGYHLLGFPHGMTASGKNGATASGREISETTP